MGLPIVECPAAAVEIADGDAVSVNLDTGVITDETTGKTYTAAPFPPFMQGIIAAGGLVSFVKKQLEGK